MGNSFDADFEEVNINTQTKTSSFDTDFDMVMNPPIPTQVKTNIFDRIKNIFKNTQNEAITLKNTAPIQETPNTFDIEFDQIMTGDDLRVTELNKRINNLSETELVTFNQKTANKDLDTKIKQADKIIKDRNKLTGIEQVKAGAKGFAETLANAPANVMSTGKYLDVAGMQLLKKVTGKDFGGKEGLLMNKEDWNRIIAMNTPITTEAGTETIFGTMTPKEQQSIGGKIGAGFGSAAEFMIPATKIKALSMVPKAEKVARASSMFGQIVGRHYNNIEQIHPEWDENKKLGYATIQGTLESSLEYWGTAQLLGEGKGTKLFSAVDKLPLFNRLKGMVYNFITEGSQELSQEVGSNIIDKFYKLPKRLSDNTLTSFLIGGVVGGSIGGISSGGFESNFSEVIPKQLKQELNNKGFTDEDINSLSKVLQDKIKKEIELQPEEVKTQLAQEIIDPIPTKESISSLEFENQANNKINQEIEIMKNEIENSEAGKRIFIPESGQVIAQSSTFPQWFKNAGFKTKKEVLKAMEPGNKNYYKIQEIAKQRLAQGIKEQNIPPDNEYLALLDTANKLKEIENYQEVDQVQKIISPEKSNIQISNDLIMQAAKANSDIQEADPLSLPPIGLSIKQIKGKTDIDITPQDNSTIKYFNELDRNRGAKNISLQDKLNKTIKDIKNEFTRVYPNLDPKKHGWLIQQLNKIKASNSYAKGQAVKFIQNIVKDFTPNEYKAFSNAIMVPDLLNDVKSGMYDGKDIPFFSEIMKEEGLDSKLLADQITVLTKLNNEAQRIAQQSSRVQEAITKRKNIMDSTTKILIDYGILDAEAIKENYFHHQVLSKLMERKLGTLKRKGTNKEVASARPGRYGFEVARTGSSLEYNTDYAESEAEVLGDMLMKIEKVGTLLKIKNVYDISDNLKKEYNAFKETNPETNMSFNQYAKKMYPDYDFWQPQRGFDFAMTKTIWDNKTLEQLLNNDLIDSNELKDIIREGLTVRGRKATWTVPKEVAETLDNIQKLDNKTVLEQIFKIPTRFFKVSVLQNPFVKPSYDFGNFVSDASRAATNRIDVFSKVKEAIPVSFEAARGNFATPDLQELNKLGFFSKGYDINDVTDQAWLKELKQNKNIPNPVKEYIKMASRFSQGRENIMRYATYLKLKEELDAGKPIWYGASLKEEIDTMKEKGASNLEIAAKIATELYGDYTNIPRAVQYLSDSLIPFVRWAYVNFRTTGMLIKNDGVKSIIKMAIPLILVNLWNMFRFPDETKELNATGGIRTPYLILGRNKETGIVRYIKITDPLSDILSWVGLDDGLIDLNEILRGDKNVPEQLKEMFITKGGVAKILGMISPAYKTPVELITGKALFPNLENPTVIRSKGEYLARSVGFSRLYKLLSGMPDKDKRKLIFDITKTMDMDESNYWYIVNKISNYNKKQGLGTTASGFSGEKADAAYFWRKAAIYNDQHAMNKYAKKYADALNKELGAQIGNKITIYNENNVGPMLSVSLEEQSPYNLLKIPRILNEMSIEDKTRFDKAHAWAVGNMRDTIDKNK